MRRNAYARAYRKLYDAGMKKYTKIVIALPDGGSTTVVDRHKTLTVVRSGTQFFSCLDGGRGQYISYGPGPMAKVMFDFEYAGVVALRRLEEDLMNEEKEQISDMVQS